MQKSRKSLPIPRDSGRNERLSIALAEYEASTSWIEDIHWERIIAMQIREFLKQGKEKTLTALAEELGEKRTQGHDLFMDILERETESRLAEDSQGLMIALPVLCWSRFVIPSGQIPTQIMQDIRVHLRAHLLARDARLAICNVLFSPDQIPQGFCDTHSLAERLIFSAKTDDDLSLAANDLPESQSFVADTRYLLAAVVATEKNPLFRWQEESISAQEANAAWCTQGYDVLRRILPSCGIRILPAGGFHAALRQSDRELRPFSLSAGVDYLKTCLTVEASSLQAVIGAYRDGETQEVRIGLGPDGHRVFHGVVWPLLDPQEGLSETLTQIHEALLQLGLRQVTRLDSELPPEFCDDCGAPLFPDVNGDPVHAENPDEQDDPSGFRQLH